MPISSQEVADQMRFALDAEGSDHYGDAEDIIPAINAAVKWMTNVVNITMGQNKAAEEVFREISVVRVFQTSEDSRISLDVFPDPVWTVLAVFPNPTIKDTGETYTPPSSTKHSAHRSDKYYVTSENDCKRLSTEEWISNKNNPFEAGYVGIDASCDLADYAYLAPKNYNPVDPAGQITREIEIRPVINQGFVAVEYAKRPVYLSALGTDDVDFPETAFQMIFDKALQYIAYKQGDQTNIYTVTSQDIQTLINALT